MKKLSKALLTLGCFCILLLTGCQNEIPLTEGSYSIKGKAYYSNCESSKNIVVSLKKGDSIVAYSDCNEDGSYTFDNLESGEYVLYAASSSSVEKIVYSTVIKVDDTTEVNIDDLCLTATGTLSGTVTLDGSTNNNAGFTVFIGGTSYNAKTGNSGTFVISDIPAGTNYEIFIEKGFYTTKWKNTNVVALSDTALGTANLTTEEIKGDTNTDTGSALNLLSINYELNGGTLSDDSPIYHIYGINTNLGTPSRDNYSFVGWYTDPEFNGRPITKLNAKSITSDITLYARWTDGIALSVNELNAKLSNSSGTVKILITDEYPDYSALATAMKGNSSVHIDLDLTLCNISAIRSEAFKDVTNLTKIDLPTSVKSIGNSAFSGCQNLKEINYLPELQTIESYAFYKCSSLKTIRFPESTLETIGSYAFSYCTSLPDMIIPDSVTSIGSYTFEEAYFTELKLPEGLTNVPTHLCYRNSKLTKVTLPSTITSFGDYSFCSCTNLSDISIPENVTRLGDGTFSTCKKITKITLPQGITYIPEYCFAASGITEIIIPDAVTKIGKFAFQNCESLKKVTIPASAKSFGSGAFNKCEAITDVEIPSLETWLKIDFASFGSGGTADEHASSNPLVYAKTLKVNGKVITDLKIPEGTTTIKDSAFYNCTGLTSLTIPASVQKISANAFEKTTFTKIYITDLAAWCSCAGNPWAGKYSTTGDLYLNGTKLTAVTIPEGVTEINSCTFYGTSITSVSLPATLKKIDVKAFAYCTGLTTITIPSSVNQIGKYAFWKCTRLNTITFANPNNWYETSDVNNYNSRSGGIKTDYITNDSSMVQKFIGTYTYTGNHVKLLELYLYK